MKKTKNPDFIKYSLILLPILFFSFLTSCELAKDVAGIGSDEDVPKVQYFSPSDNAVGVPIDRIVTIVFSKQMDTNSLIDAFIIDPSISGLQQWSNNNTKLEFIPDTNYEIYTTYTVLINTQAKDVEGNALIQKVQWSFTTGENIDNVPPAVLSISPSDLATDVAVTSNIAVTFNEMMDEDSAQSAFSMVESDSGTGVEGVFTWEGEMMVFNPNTELSYSKGYLITIGTGASDLAGNTMSEQFNSTFTTASTPDTIPPMINSVSPSDGATGVMVSTNIEITFSEQMDRTSAETSFSLTDSGGNKISGTLSWSGDKMIFNPTNNLIYNTKYYVKVTTEAKDVSGNPLSSEFNSSFTTVSESSSQWNKMVWNTDVWG